MDKVRRRKILSSIDDLYEILDDLRNYSFREDEARKKIPLSRKYEDERTESENVSDALDKAVEAIKDAISYLREVEDY